MKNKTIHIVILGSLMSIMIYAYAAQQPTQRMAYTHTDTSSRYAHKLIMASLQSLTDNDSYAIYFEGLAAQLKDPKQIFTLPSYQVYRGGYMYVDKNKFELKMGSIQGMSDGTLVVYIHQDEKVMMVDSVRNDYFIDGASTQQIQLEQTHTTQQLIGADSISEKNCTYLGKEKINGKECHKIKADFKGEINTHYYYWVEVATSQMLLMGEWAGDGYNAYWIKKITDTAPKGHIYSVNLPAKKMTEFYGMEVIDNRYVKHEAQKALQQD